MKTADQFFRELEQKRMCIVNKLVSNYVPENLSDIIAIDENCIWHAGQCEFDDPEKRVLEDGCFLDSVRARSFQCSGCKRISIFSNCIHQHIPVSTFKINKGFREGMEFRIQITECSYKPKLFYNHISREIRTPKVIHDTLIHYLIQYLLEQENCWGIERIYDTYVCGDKIISIRENPQIPCLYSSSSPTDYIKEHEECEEQIPRSIPKSNSSCDNECNNTNANYKVKKSLARSSMCTLLKILLKLKPYNFVFGGVNKNSFIFNTVPSKGQLGNISYESKDTIKIKDFTCSSIRVGTCENDNRLVPDTSTLDALTRHAEARVVVKHNHYNEKGKKCKMYRQVFNLVGIASDIEHARHIHFSSTINFALNIYLTLAALMCIKPIHDKIFEDKEAKRIWFSIWPHGECQALEVARSLNHSSGTSCDILSIIGREDLYLEPILPM